MGRLGEARLNTSPSVTTHGLSPIVRSARHRRLRRPRWGTAVHGAEPGRSCSAQRYSAPPAAGPTGAAGRGPRRKLPGTTWPNHIDLGPTGTWAVSGLQERRQAGASTSRRHGPWTRMESRRRASSGPENEYDLGTITRTSDWRSNRFPLKSNRRSRISIIDCNRYDLIAAEHQIKAWQERISS